MAYNKDRERIIDAIAKRHYESNPTLTPDDFPRLVAAMMREAYEAGHAIGRAVGLAEAGATKKD